MSINIPIPKIEKRKYFEAKPPQDGEIEGVDYIVCPVCGATLRTHIKKHLIKQHQMSMEEFKEKYPNSKTFPYKWNRKRKETRERKKANFVLLPKDELKEKFFNIIEEKIDKKKEDEKKYDIIEKVEKVEETEKKEDFFIENPFEIIYNEFKRTEKRIKRMEDMLREIKGNLEEMKNMWK